LEAVSSAERELAADTRDGGGELREDVINRFRQSVSDRVSLPDGVAVRPFTIAPGPADRRFHQGERITQIIERINEIQTTPIPRSRHRRN
jgi:hypothetical protein